MLQRKETMWIEDTPAGTYKYSKRFKNEYTGKWQKVSITRPDKSLKTQRVMPTLLYERYLEKYSMAEEKNLKDVPLEEILKQTLEANRPPVMANATYAGYKSAYNRLPKKLKDVLISKITVTMFNRYLKQLYREGASNSKMQTATSALRMALDHAVADGHQVDPTIAGRIDYPRQIEIRNNRKYLTMEELMQVEEQLINNGHYDCAHVVHVQAFTGMRIGEVLALRLKDVDVKSKTIQVKRSLDQYTAEYGPTKSRDRREAFMMDDLPEVLKKIKDAREKQGATPDDQLFLNNHGTPMRYSSVRRPLSMVYIEGKEITSHIFRHTYVTLLIDAGVDINLIAKQVGHSGTRMVEEVYGHYTDKAKKKLKNILTNIDLSE